MLKLLWGILFFIWSIGARSAGFECKNAATSIEKMICAENELSNLDELLAATYQRSLESSPRADLLKSEQKKWLAKVRNPCRKPECLKRAYQERISKLDGMTASGSAEASEVGDFNFDGEKDIAVVNGHGGAYGSYTYNVYLYSKRKKGFELNEPLSTLTLEYMGLFQVDARKKHLITMRKSGCCYHEYAEHEIRDNRPVEVLHRTEDATVDGEHISVTESRLVDGNWQSTTKQYLIEDYTGESIH